MMLSNPVAVLAMNPTGPAMINKPFEASRISGKISLKVSNRVSFHGICLNSFLSEVRHGKYLQSRDNYKN